MLAKCDKEVLSKTSLYSYPVYIAERFGFTVGVLLRMRRDAYECSAHARCWVYTVTGRRQI